MVPIHNGKNEDRKNGSFEVVASNWAPRGSISCQWSITCWNFSLLWSSLYCNFVTIIENVRNLLPSLLILLCLSRLRRRTHKLSTIKTSALGDITVKAGHFLIISWFLLKFPQLWSTIIQAMTILDFDVSDSVNDGTKSELLKIVSAGDRNQHYLSRYFIIYVFRQVIYTEPGLNDELVNGEWKTCFRHQVFFFYSKSSFFQLFPRLRY